MQIIFHKKTTEIKIKFFKKHFSQLIIAIVEQQIVKLTYFFECYYLIKKIVYNNVSDVRLNFLSIEFSSIIYMICFFILVVIFLYF